MTHYTKMISIKGCRRRAVLQISDDLIRSATWPLSQVAMQSFATTVDAEAREQGLAEIRQAVESLAVGEADEAAGKAKFNQISASLVIAEEQLQQTEPGRWIKAVIFDLSALACFVAEFAFTYATLPFLLNIAPGSLMGVMVAAAPTTAMVVMDVVIARLFENPYQAVHDVVSRSRLRKLFFGALMACWLSALAAGNIYVVMSLADAREEASLIYQRLTDPEAEIADDAEADNKIVKKAIIAVSVMVTLDGAVLLLMGLNETRRCRRFSRARRTVTVLRAQRQRWHQQWLRSEAVVKLCRHNFENVRERARLAEIQYKGLRYYQLEQTLNARARARKANELVEDILVGRVQAADMKLPVCSAS